MSSMQANAQQVTRGTAQMPLQTKSWTESISAIGATVCCLLESEYVDCIQWQKKEFFLQNKPKILKIIDAVFHESRVEHWIDFTTLPGMNCDQDIIVKERYDSDRRVNGLLWVHKSGNENIVTIPNKIGMDSYE